jgi:Mpv17 / PMP22 family.
MALTTYRNLTPTLRKEYDHNYTTLLVLHWLFWVIFTLTIFELVSVQYLSVPMPVLTPL